MDIFNDFEEFEDQELQEIVDFVNPERHSYTVRERIDHFERWDEKEFLRRFRLSKATVMNLLKDIESQLLHRSDRNNAVPPLHQLLLTLKYLASGCFYIAAGDFVGIHKSTAGTIIPRVLLAIAQLRKKYIKFPITIQEQQDTVRRFGLVANFPRVVGALDCTHVKLLSPGGPNAETFRNRKGFMSLNVQAICDSQTKIIDLVARWPGSTHDNHIFSNSLIKMKFENGSMNNMLLVGDSGYPVTPYLMTPLLNPKSDAENLYNESQIRTRNVIERTFGIWKRRFPILCTGLRCRLPLAQRIITVTAILHNLAVKYHDNIPDDDEEYEDPVFEVEPPNEEINNNDIIRRTIIHYFQSLL